MSFQKVVSNFWYAFMFKTEGEWTWGVMCMVYTCVYVCVSVLYVMFLVSTHKMHVYYIRIQIYTSYTHVGMHSNAHSYEYKYIFEYVHTHTPTFHTLRTNACAFYIISYTHIHRCSYTHTGMRIYSYLHNTYAEVDMIIIKTFT